jgi:hypothetical protein
MKILQPVCVGASDIVFVPVSHDIAAFRTSYAVTSMSNPDADSASTVCERENNWLNVNGCDDPRQDTVDAATKPESRGVDF